MIIPNTSNRIGFIPIKELYYPLDSTVLTIEITDQYKELSFYQVTTSSINWGDGTEDNLTSHAYTQNGTYIVELKHNTALRCNLGNFNYTIIKVLNLSNLFIVAYNMFFNCKNLEYINSINWDTSNITKFNNFANGCTNLTTLDVSNWDTSNVIDFSGFAFGCTNLTILDFSNWDTSNVNNFDSFVANCTSLKILDFSSFIIKNETNIYKIVLSCKSVTKAFAINQTTCDRLNATNKPTTWEFVVK